MNKKFVYQVGNNKKSYTMMHGQPNIKICLDSFEISLSLLQSVQWLGSEARGSSHHNTQIDSQTHLASYSMGTGKYLYETFLVV